MIQLADGLPISNPTQKWCGRVDRVEVELVRGARSRRWVTSFLLCGKQMYFVSNVDVSLFARNRPSFFKDGDELIVVGQNPGFPFFAPRDRPKDGYYEVKAGRVISTGSMFGTNGVKFILFGSLASALGAGLLIGIISAGSVAIWSHLYLSFQAALLLAGGSITIRMGLAARAIWKAVKSTT